MMKSLLNVLILICLLISILSLKTLGQEKYVITSHGQVCKILKSGNERKVQTGDVVTLNFIEKTENDSILFSTYVLSNPLKITVHDPNQAADLMDVLLAMHEHDSASISIPGNLLFATRESIRPSYLSKDGSINFILKIEAVQSAAESEETEKALENQNIQLLERYMSKQKAKTWYTAPGFLYAVIHAKKTLKPEVLDTVTFDYNISALDGRRVAGSVDSEEMLAGKKRNGTKRQTYVIGSSNKLSAWDKALLLIPEEATYLFVIESGLLFDVNPQAEFHLSNSPVLLKIELLNIKKGPSSIVISNRPLKAGATVIEASSNPPFFASAMTSIFIILNTNASGINADTGYKLNNAEGAWSLRWLEIIKTRLGL